MVISKVRKWKIRVTYSTGEISRVIWCSFSKIVNQFYFLFYAFTIYYVCLVFCGHCAQWRIIIRISITCKHQEHTVT